jgi:hypothetical protein
MATDWNLWMDRLLAERLTVAEHRLALALARQLLGWKTRRGPLGRVVLLETSGLDRRTFQRALSGLAEKGLVDVEKGRPGRGNRSTYTLLLADSVNGAEERPFAGKKKGRSSAPFSMNGHPEKGRSSAPFTARKNGAVERPRRERTKPKTKPFPAAEPPVKTIQAQVIEAYSGAGGSLEVDEWRGALVRQAKTLTERGLAASLIVTAARELGRERAFPGHLTKTAESLAASGGPCAWRGLQRGSLTPEQLAECSCGACAEWLDFAKTEAVIRG